MECQSCAIGDIRQNNSKRQTPHVKTIVENHSCDGTDEACALEFDFPSKNLKTGKYLLVVVASVDEFTAYFINEVKVVK